MLINQLTWRGIPIWPPQWYEENCVVSKHGLLKNVKMLPITRLIIIEAACAGTSISGFILTSAAYYDSLYRKLRENIGKPVAEVGKMEIELSGPLAPGSPAGGNEEHGMVYAG